MPHIDGPPTDEQPDPIQPSARDPREIFVGLYDGVKGTCESIRVNEEWRQVESADLGGTVER